MRIWHEQLIPKLCQKHLCAMWREGLRAYSIITENNKGYRNHPAVKEFENAPSHLFLRLLSVRREMIIRGYKPKEICVNHSSLWFDKKTGQAYILGKETIKEWQSLDEQIKILKAKGCKCKV